MKDQWRRKKQTKEEARAAKRAKLDPDNAKTARDVLDEQAALARKRKREDDEDTTEVEGIEVEKPISGSAKKSKQTKKQKREAKGVFPREHPEKGQDSKGGAEQQAKDEVALQKEKAERRRLKREQKKAKEAARIAKPLAKKERKAGEAALVEDSHYVAGDDDLHEGQDGEDEDNEIDIRSIKDITEDVNHPSSTASPSTNRSPAFDASNSNSGSSSISSIIPTSNENQQPEDKNLSLSTESEAVRANPEDLKVRLAQRIEALRAARNASGDAPKNRQELMEQRRAKEEQRRAHKKELRRQAREEEQRQRNETLARGSPLLSGTPLLSPGSPLTPSSDSNSFSFGRVNLANGLHATANLNAILEPKTKTKGPSDPRTALVAAQNKQSRINGLDEAKRADIDVKDSWLNARKRAHGERTLDDTSLLKKTLKRKEKQKKKSEKEWNERIEGVKKGQDFRQKKREANLQKRKEEKGGKGKKGKGVKKAKAKARPGFEGSFRAKPPRAIGAGEGGSGQQRR